MGLKFQGSEIRAWIMFVVALILLVFFAVKGTQLGPYWTLMLGSMLGLTIIVSAIQGLTGGKPRSDDEKDIQQSKDVREQNSKDEMGDPGIPHFRVLGVSNAGSI